MTAAQMLKDVSKKDSHFMKRFGNVSKFEKVMGQEILDKMGVRFHYFEMYYNFSLRNVCEKAGFIIEPAYPVNSYNSLSGVQEYYILRSPFEKVKTRSTIVLHLLMKSFLATFLKNNRDVNKLIVFVEEMKKHFKIQDVDKYRLLEYGKILLKAKEIRLGTFYNIVSRHIIDAKMKEKLPIVLINSLKNPENSIDLKDFKEVVKLLDKLDLQGTVSVLNELDFSISAGKKKLSFKGKSLKDYALVPFNPYLDRKGQLKLDKKSVASLNVSTKKAQRVLSKILKSDDAEVVIVQKPKTKDLSNDLVQTYLNDLICKDAWTLSELDAYSKTKDIMRMKLILKVNEYTDEVFGDFLLVEDNKKFLINKYIAEQIHVGV